MKSAFSDDKQGFLNLKKVSSKEATESTQKKMQHAQRSCFSFAIHWKHKV